MGGIITPSVHISGNASQPGVNSLSDPTTGLFSTTTGGVGIAVASKDIFELNTLTMSLGYVPTQPVAITAVAGSPFALAVGGITIAVSTLGEHVFILGDNSVEVLSKNEVTGALTQVIGSPFACSGGSRSIVCSPDGGYVLIGTNGLGVTVFKYSAGTGILTQVAGSPFKQAGYPNSTYLKMSGNGYIYLNQGNGNFGVMKLDTTTGQLTAVDNFFDVVVGNSGPMICSPNNDRLFVLDIVNQALLVFMVNPLTGKMSQLTGNYYYQLTDSPNADGLAVSKDGKFIFASVGGLGNGTLTVFSHNLTNGNLTQKSILNSDLANGFWSLDVSGDNAYLVTSFCSARLSRCYSWDNLGNLTQVGGDFATGGPGAILSRFFPDHSLVVSLNTNTNAANVYSMNAKILCSLMDAVFDPAGGGEGLLNLNAGVKIKGVTAATLVDVANAALGMLNDRGNYNASVNTFPAAGGSGAAGAIMKGDTWYIGATGTLGGVLCAVGDTVRALVNTPAQVAANWDILQVAGSYALADVAAPVVMVTNAANLAIGATGANFYDVTGALTANGQITTTFPAGPTLVIFDNATTGAFLLQINAGAYTIPAGRSIWYWNGATFEMAGSFPFVTGNAGKFLRVDSAGIGSTWDGVTTDIPVAMVANAGAVNIDDSGVYVVEVSGALTAPGALTPVLGVALTATTVIFDNSTTGGFPLVVSGAYTIPPGRSIWYYNGALLEPVASSGFRTANVTPLPVAGAVVAVNHLLGAAPVDAVLEIVCLAAELGYGIGDIVASPVQFNAVTQELFAWINATQIGFTLAAGFVLETTNKTTGALATPTAANWAYRFSVRP